MPRLKVLYVDDHIPDDNIPDAREEIRKTLRERYPERNDEDIEEWTTIYYYARQVKNTLGESYDVTTENEHQKAMKLAEDSHFDIAIVDVGWFNDEKRNQRSNFDNAGWEICDKIEETDQKLHCRPTLRIAYSQRFVDKPHLSIEAAGRGALPFFKTREETNALALKAVVKFLEKQLSDPSPQEQFARTSVKDFHDMTIGSFEQLQKQQRQWSILTLVFVAMSLFLVLTGAVSAIFWNVQVEMVTSISSIITGAISSLLFVQLQKAQKTIKESQKTLIQQYKEAVERLYNIGTEHT